MEERITAILEFWFGSKEQLNDAEHISERLHNFWFSKDEESDKIILKNFEEDYYKAKKGEYDSWKSTPQGKLALIILFDQFSRNMFRDSPLAFDADSLALKMCIDGITAEENLSLSVIERNFFYMPLMHTEDLTYQQMGIKQFEKLIQDAPKKLKEHFTSVLDFAHRHKDIVERFGRFPHRNSTLGRFSTREEQEFLKQPGSSF